MIVALVTKCISSCILINVITQNVTTKCFTGFILSIRVNNLYMEESVLLSNTPAEMFIVKLAVTQFVCVFLHNK